MCHDNQLTMLQYHIIRNMKCFECWIKEENQGKEEKWRADAKRKKEEKCRKKWAQRFALENKSTQSFIWTVYIFRSFVVVTFWLRFCFVVWCLMRIFTWNHFHPSYIIVCGKAEKNTHTKKRILRDKTNGDWTISTLLIFNTFSCDAFVLVSYNVYSVQVVHLLLMLLFQ